MLDEALSVLVGLWTGEPFSYSGQHYRIERAQFLPRPLQQPRVPIWVGGNWPNKPPFRRAASWDGVFPLFSADDNAQELAQLADMVRYVRQHRTRDEPMDVVCMGVTRDAESRESTELVAQRAELGATWWLECLTPYRYGLGYEDQWPADAMRERVLQGPPQLSTPHTRQESAART